MTLRPITGPLALGFFGLACATFVMAGLQLGWVEATERRQVALCILAFTVPLQFTASLFGFLAPSLRTPGCESRQAARLERLGRRSLEEGSVGSEL